MPLRKVTQPASPSLHCISFDTPVETLDNAQLARDRLVGRTAVLGRLFELLAANDSGDAGIDFGTEGNGQFWRGLTEMARAQVDDLALVSELLDADQPEETPKGGAR